MTAELRLAKVERDSTGRTYRPATPRVRNLGSAIFWRAISDYRSMNQEAHEDAELFLYPQTPEWQRQYDWAVTMAEGVNRTWLRDALDRFKDRWDRQRAVRKGGGYENWTCS
jgi:hypothetical protein